MKNQILLAILVLGMARGFYACGDHEAHMAEVKEQIKAEMACNLIGVNRNPIAKCDYNSQEKRSLYRSYGTIFWMVKFIL